MRGFVSSWLFVVIAMFYLGMPLSATAAIPQQITYQGYLTATDGTPVNKTVTLNVSIYDVASGGVPLWSDQQVVAVANGQFSINLGPTSLPFDKPYLLGIKVDNDQEMTPRQAITSSPYALRSASADAVADGAVGTGALIDGSVTASKLGIACGAGQVLTRSATGWGCGSAAATSSSAGGTITGVIAGAGLTGGGTAGSVTLDLSFAGTGSASSVARSDHNHDALYQKKYGKVAVVAQSGGDYSSPAAALADAATWCGAASAANPCLVKIMPGLYDLGAAPLVMSDFIDMEGSGETNSTISGAIDSATSGVIQGANAALSRLTVINSGGAGAQNAIAIFNTSAAFTLSQVSARAAGAVNSYAVYNSGAGSVRIGSSYLEAPGFTIFNGASATATVFTTAFNGGSVSNAGSLTCSASRDKKNVFYFGTCPPFQTLAVITSQPDYSTSVQSNPLIKAQFSNDMNPATINSATFTLMDAATGGYLNGTVQYDAGNRTAIFTPSVALSSTFVAVIGTGVRDMSGGKLAAPYSWQFYAAGGAADTKAPVVLSVTPSDKSNGILPATLIEADFDKSIDRLVSSAGLLTLVDANGAAIPGKVQVSGQRVLFSPNAPLALGVTYTATVSGARDLAGNTQSAPFAWSFSTTPLTAPSGVGASASTTNAVVTWQPVDGATSYNLYWASAPFSGSVSVSSGTLVSPAKVTGAVSPYTFTPPASPPFTGTLAIYTSGAASSPIGGIQFTLTLPAGITVANISVSPYYSGMVSFNQVSANQVRVAYLNPYYGGSSNSYPLVNVQCSGDSTGKTLADFSFSDIQVVGQNGSPISGMGLTTNQSGTAGTSYFFAVSAVNAKGESPNSTLASASIDPFPPIVTGVNPTGTAADISSQIFAGFSEPIDMQSVTAASFAVSANGAPVAGSFAQGNFCGNNGCLQGVQFLPATPLAQGTNYAVTLAGIKDPAGNALQSPYTWNFTTTISAPTNVTASKGNLQATLSWQGVSGATSYNIYWSTTSGVSAQNGTKISVTGGTSYTQTGLSNGATYYYVVTAVLGSSEGLPSNQVSVLIDNVPPTVTSTTPADSATGVSISNQIYVAFSKSINPATWNNTTVTLKDSSGNPVNGSYYGYGSPSFSPSPALGFNKTYTMTIGTGVQDSAGNGLTTPYSFSFATTAVGAPSNLVATRGNLQSSLTWTAATAATGYNIYWSTFYGVTPQNGNKISGIIGTSYTHTGLVNGTTYYYVVTALNGTVEGLPSMQAQILIDNVAPTVSATTPAGNATGVSTSSQVYVSFSKAINPATWNSTTVSFKDNHGALVDGSYNNGYFFPSQAFGFNATYTMAIGTGVQDNAGNALATPYSFSFTTAAVGTPANLVATKGNLQSSLTWTAAAAATGYNIYWSTSPGVTPQNGTKISGVTGTSYTHTGLVNGTTYYYVVTAVNGTAEGQPSMQAQVLIDNVAPTVSSTTPVGNSTGALISNPIYVTFSKQINPATWNNSTVTVKDSNGVVLNGSYNFGYPPSFTPSLALGFNASYTMTIGTGVQDNAGNGLAAPYSFSFTTAMATPMGLTVTAGALQSALTWLPVSGATSYNIYWSNTTGITKTNSIKISTGSSATSYSHTNLANGSTYVYRVAAVVGSNESDLSNEVMVSFDTTPPVVSSITGGYAGSTVLYVNFNEPLDAGSVSSNSIQVTSNGAAVASNYTSLNTNSTMVWVGPVFNYGTTYTVAVGGVKDMAGNLMAPYSKTFTTDVLGVPAVSATAGGAGTHQITLNWGAVSGATTYNVYWSTTPGVIKANGTEIVGAMPPFTHTGLTAGTTYYYVVTAVSGTTEGAASGPSGGISAVAP